MKKQSKRHALISGGAGFIGSHLVDSFLSDGWRVTVLDNLCTGTLRNLSHLGKLFFQLFLLFQDLGCREGLR